MKLQIRVNSFGKLAEFLLDSDAVSAMCVASAKHIDIYTNEGGSPFTYCTIGNECFQMHLHGEAIGADFFVGTAEINGAIKKVYLQRRENNISHLKMLKQIAHECDMALAGLDIVDGTPGLDAESMTALAEFARKIRAIVPSYIPSTIGTDII